MKGREGMGWEGIGRDRKGREGMGWEGMGREGKGRRGERSMKQL